MKKKGKEKMRGRMWKTLRIVESDTWDHILSPFNLCVCVKILMVESKKKLETFFGWFFIYF